MTIKSISQFEQLIREAMRLARFQVPIDTGNLRLDSIKLRRTGDLTWEIYIDEQVAPYAKYVNEHIPSHHTPKQYSNEQFWKRFCKVFMRELQNKLGGKLDRETKNEDKKGDQK